LGEVCTFECGTGFDENGEGIDSITCLASGEWSSTPFACVERDCGSNLPVTTTSAEASFDCGAVTTVGATCAATCNLGFTQAAGTVGDYICDASGSWVPAFSGPEIECVAVTCDPAIGMDAASDFVCPSASFGDQCTVTCNEGYNTVSSTPFTCDTSGSFTGGSYSCAIVTCGALPVSGEGIVVDCARDEYLDVSCPLRLDFIYL
jgi:hypothetical protein